MAIEQFLTKLRCPECRQGTISRADGGEALICSACQDRSPIVEGVPLLFASDTRAEFIRLDDSRRGTEPAQLKPGEHAGGVYHWREYHIEDFLPPAEDGQDVLLFGCGDAGEKTFLTNAGFEALAFDVRRSSGTDLLADGHNLPFQDSSFDVVLSMQVLEHLHSPWLAVGEIARILRPGGCFVGSVAFLKPFHSSYFHMTHAGVDQLLGSAGLKVDKLEGAQSVTYSILGSMLPAGSRRFRRPILGFVDRLILGLRRRLWIWKTGLNPREPTNRFSDRHALSFNTFDRLRFAPSVVFRGIKQHGKRASNC
ncbi:MAG: methyltransferase domain-containing protein [Gemmatimonadota bacterium]